MLMFDRIDVKLSKKAKIKRPAYWGLDDEDSIKFSYMLILTWAR